MSKRISELLNRRRQRREALRALAQSRWDDLDAVLRTDDSRALGLTDIEPELQ